MAQTFSAWNGFDSIYSVTCHINEYVYSQVYAYIYIYNTDIVLSQLAATCTACVCVCVCDMSLNTRVSR